MSKTERGQLGQFLEEVIHWTWDEFCKAELDTDYKGYQGAVLSLVRQCADGKLGPIKLAIDRVDGKIETPVRVEYPQVFMLFPEAKKVALGPAEPGSPAAALAAPETFDTIKEAPEEDSDDKNIATMTLRETLTNMADTPRKVPLMIHARKDQIETAMKKGEPLGDETTIPLVKSVISANLLLLAESGKFEAITEVFDQIDGKLVETIRVLGEDMYLVSYVLEAPFGAVKNKDGVYYLQAPQISDAWESKFKSK